MEFPPVGLTYHFHGGPLDGAVRDLPEIHPGNLFRLPVEIERDEHHFLEEAFAVYFVEQHQILEFSHYEG